MEHGREHISPHAKKGLCWANRRLCRPSQGWWGEGAGARRTRGEENYKRFCGVPFQGRRPKGNVIVVVWYTSRREHGYIYIQQINKPTSVPGAVLPVPPEATSDSPATRLPHRRSQIWEMETCAPVSGFWLLASLASQPRVPHLTIPPPSSSSSSSSSSSLSYRD